MTENGHKPFVPVTDFYVIVHLPQIYPDTAKEPFKFRMKVQLVGEAEKLQTAFLMLADEEQKGDVYHEYNANMIAQLCTEPPQGFSDFADYMGNTPLADALKTYFYPGDPTRKEGMAFICRKIMVRYWQAVQPADYL